MAKGKKLTVEEREQILEQYVMTENLETVCRVTGRRPDTVIKTIRNNSDRLEELREIKKKEYDIDFKKELRKRAKMFIRIIDAYGEHALQPEVIAAASGRDSIIVIGTAIDKGRVCYQSPEDVDESRTGVIILEPVGERNNERSMETPAETG